MLLDGNYFLVLLLTIFIGLAYAFFLYLIAPYKSIKISTGRYYLIFGMLSISLVQYFLMAFPGWSGYVEWTNLNMVIFIKAFVQVALLEEGAKLMSFSLIDKFRKRKTEKDEDNEHPIGIMFNVAMVSLSFAIVENFMYAMRVPDDFILKLLMMRTVTATVLHLLAGLLMGYWIAIGRMKIKSFQRSLWGMLVSKRKWIRRTWYTLIGLFTAAIIHGIYDFNLFIGYENSTPAMITILFMGLLLTYGGAKHLDEIHRDSKDKKKLS